MNYKLGVPDYSRIKNQLNIKATKDVVKENMQELGRICGFGPNVKPLDWEAMGCQSFSYDSEIRSEDIHALRSIQFYAESNKEEIEEMIKRRGEGWKFISFFFAIHSFILSYFHIRQGSKEKQNQEAYDNFFRFLMPQTDGELSFDNLYQLESVFMKCLYRDWKGEYKQISCPIKHQPSYSSSFDLVSKVFIEGLSRNSEICVIQLERYMEEALKKKRSSCKKWIFAGIIIALLIIIGIIVAVCIGEKPKQAGSVQSSSLSSKTVIDLSENMKNQKQYLQLQISDSITQHFLEKKNSDNAFELTAQSCESSKIQDQSKSTKKRKQKSSSIDQKQTKRDLGQVEIQNPQSNVKKGDFDFKPKIIHRRSKNLPQRHRSAV